jgi:hypothetical protein
MATERLSMRKTREILRQKWALKRTHREVALSLGVSAGAVGGAVLRAQAAGLDWATAEGLTEEALDRRLYGQRVAAGGDFVAGRICSRLGNPEFEAIGGTQVVATLQIAEVWWRHESAGGSLRTSRRRWLRLRWACIRKQRRWWHERGNCGADGE